MYKIVQNKKGPDNQVFEVQIVCDKGFLLINNFDIKKILEENNLWLPLEEIIKKGGRLRVTNVYDNIYETIDLKKWSAFLKSTIIQEKKATMLMVKKGNIVELKTGEIGIIIKYSSNAEMYLKTPEGTEVKFAKLDAIRILEN